MSSPAAASSSSVAADSSNVAVAPLIPILPLQPPSMQSQEEVEKQLQKFTDSFQDKALHIIYEIIPTKVDALQAILDQFRLRECDAPVFTPMGAQSNKSLQDLMSAIKSEVHALLSYIDPLRMWVALNIPKIQDQKGVSVSVKEDLVEMLKQSKQAALGLMESMAKYFVGRGKLVSKRLKFPLSEDHEPGIAELDRKQYFLSLNMVNDIKNNYSIIYDMVTKNMDKLVRQTDLENYRSMY